MSEQNLYEIWCEYQEGWFEDGEWPGDTWQDAIQNWVEDYWKDLKVYAPKPSSDGMSGSMKITEDPRPEVWALRSVKATITDYY